MSQSPAEEGNKMARTCTKDGNEDTVTVTIGNILVTLWCFIQ